jgi:hypothetical protein
MTTEREVADMVQTWDTAQVMAALECTVRGSWLARVFADELAARGVGLKGQWIGFPAARRLWVGASGRG